MNATPTGIPAMTTTQLIDYDAAIGRGLDLKGITDNQRRTMLTNGGTSAALEARNVASTN